MLLSVFESRCILRKTVIWRGEDLLETGKKFNLRCNHGFHPNSHVTSGQCHDGKLITTKDGRPIAKCVKQACTLPAVQNGTVHVKSPGVVVVGSVGKVSCNEGYGMVGMRDITCTSSGQFTRHGRCVPHKTNCMVTQVKHGNLIKEVVENKDNHIEEISNNAATNATFGGVLKNGLALTIEEGVRVTCKEGYYLLGEETVSCWRDVDINLLLPTCVLTNPATVCDVSAIEGTNVTLATHVISGDVINVTCPKEEVFIGGNPKKTCGNDGNFYPIGGRCAQLSPGHCAVPNVPNSSENLLEQLQDGDYFLLTCKDGYIPIGETMTRCRGDGVFYPSVGSCVGVCEVNEETDNGALSPAGTVPDGTVITATCNPGYISTSPTACSKTPSFQPPICIPRDCSPPELTRETRVVRDHVTYLLPCNNTLTCYTNGSVIETDRSCRSCDASRIKYGFVLPLVGTHFSAECYAGFYPTKQDWTCDESPAECARACQNVTLTNGNLTAARWPPLPGDTVEITECRPGYQITGYQRTTCLEPVYPEKLPQYDKKPGSCEPVYCPQLFVVDGAVIPEGRPRAGKKVFVNCEIGWNLAGPSEAWCQDDGTYDEYAVGPCIKTTFNRCPLRQPLNGYTTPLLPSVPEGRFVQIHCNKSYHLVGNNYVRCGDIGLFDYPLGTCVLEAELDRTVSYQTYDPASSSNVAMFNMTLNRTHCEEYRGSYGKEGIIKPSGRVRVGEEIVLACPDGWTVVGNLTSECRPNGTYAHILGVCSYLTCPEIEPRKGEIRPVGRITEDTMITLTCPVEHVIIGQLTVRCLKGGFYNDTIGECRRVCQPPVVENADLQIYQPARVGIRISYDLRKTIYEGSIVSVYCERGYTLVGTQRMTCHENGTYDVVTPKCRSSIRCPVPEIDNGYTGARGFVPEGETVFMACNYGLPNGHQSATCLPTGSLDRPLGSCSSYGFCSIARDNTTSRSPYRLSPGREYSLTCVDGFLPVGNNAVRCMGTDLFNVSLGSCIQTNVTCKVPLKKNGMTSFEGNMLPGISVILSCEKEYFSNGSTIATCLINGTLDRVLGNCVKDNTSAVCVSPKIRGGYPSVWGHIPQNTTLQIHCHPGYQLRGNQYITCLGNNLFDRMPGECEMWECGVTVPHGGSYNISVGVTQRVQCNEGYNLQGSGLMRCKESGVEPGYGACIKTEKEDIASRTSDKSEYPAKMTKFCKRATKGGVYTGPVVGTPLSRRDSAMLNFLEMYERCSVSGGQFVRTFDGLTYQFQSSCSYIFATDCRDYDFFIYGEMGRCSETSSASCILSATIFKGIDSITVKRGWGIVFDDQVYYISPNRKRILGSTTVYRTETHLYLQHRLLDIVLRYDGLLQVEILKPRGGVNRMCGLCGTPNSNPHDDLFIWLAAKIAPSVETFVQTYETGLEKCGVVSVPRSPCHNNQELHSKAKDLCSILLSGPFSSCHKVLPGDSMYEQCVSEVCLVDWRRDLYLPFCAVLSEIASTCVNGGVKMRDWRCGTPCDWKDQYKYTMDLLPGNWTDVAKESDQLYLVDNGR